MSGPPSRRLIGVNENDPNFGSDCNECDSADNPESQTENDERRTEPDGLVV
jgi:hypothetical protein